MGMLRAWWAEWKVQGFPHLLPFHSKAAVARHTNLEVGDICQLLYNTKVAKYYRLCVVTAIKVSDGGVIHTVEIGLRNRQGGSKGLKGGVGG